LRYSKFVQVVLKPMDMAGRQSCPCEGFLVIRGGELR